MNIKLLVSGEGLTDAGGEKTNFSEQQDGPVCIFIRKILNECASVELEIINRPTLKKYPFTMRGKKKSVPGSGHAELASKLAVRSIEMEASGCVLFRDSDTGDHSKVRNEILNGYRNANYEKGIAAVASPSIEHWLLNCIGYFKNMLRSSNTAKEILNAQLKANQKEMKIEVAANIARDCELGKIRCPGFIQFRDDLEGLFCKPATTI